MAVWWRRGSGAPPSARLGSCCIPTPFRALPVLVPRQMVQASGFRLQSTGCRLQGAFTSTRFDWLNSRRKTLSLTWSPADIGWLPWGSCLLGSGDARPAMQEEEEEEEEETTTTTRRTSRMRRRRTRRRRSSSSSRRRGRRQTRKKRKRRRFRSEGRERFARRRARGRKVE